MLRLVANDDDGDRGKANDVAVLVAMLAGFDALLAGGRLAETKVPIYTRLLSAAAGAGVPARVVLCARHDFGNDDDDDGGSECDDECDARTTFDVARMCCDLYRTHPSERTADVLIRRRNAGDDDDDGIARALAHSNRTMGYVANYSYFNYTF